MSKAPKVRLRSELEGLINREGLENGSDTPDFVLAKYLVSCLSAFDEAVRERRQWYGKATAPEKAITT